MAQPFLSFFYLNKLPSVLGPAEASVQTSIFEPLSDIEEGKYFIDWKNFIARIDIQNRTYNMINHEIMVMEHIVFIQNYKNLKLIQIMCSRLY